MINPSINGWIDKFFLEKKSKINQPFDEVIFYSELRSNGFLFGNIIDVNNDKNLLKSELYKVAILEALFGVFRINNNSNINFITTCNVFFNELNPVHFNILHNILPKNSEVIILEKNIEERIHLNENILSKTFSHLVSNTFLFVDILAFQQFLKLGFIPDKYLKKTEEAIISIVTLALKTKSNKSKHDDLLIKLFEASTRFNKFSEINIFNLEDINLSIFESNLEKKYLIDLSSLTLWSDGKIENNEVYFLQKLAEVLNVSNEYVNESIDKTNEFITKNKSKLPFFNDANPVKSFYDQTTQNVMTLIIRNKKRLTKEIHQSKELMQLLAISTQRNLNENEKKKVKKQLLDICKSVPSLTIFLIPGGSLLLPILIKFIPQLLPTSFNENLEES